MALALALPGSARAKAGHRQLETVVLEPEGPEAEFALAGSNGYKLEFRISAGSNSVDAARESKSDGVFRREGAFYSASSGHVTLRRLDARLGPIARVSVRFVPSGKVRRYTDPNCKGGPEVTRFGTFVGTIRMHGEHGYTNVAAKRARGTVDTAPLRVCRLPVYARAASGGEALVTTTLAANLEGVESYSGFEASLSQEPDAEARFDAFAHDASHGVGVSRRVEAFAAPATFSFDATLDNATVSPPAPFSGSASFQRIDDFASRWQGPLSVDLPGRPGFALTGRNFSWSLTREVE